MKYAIFSDVHSNYEALKTFLLYTDSVPGLKRICLGDIVGYSSRPNECIRLLLERDIPMIVGNHDYAIYSNEERTKFNPVALKVIEWQAKILLPEYRKLLVDLPLVLKISNLISITHADFSSPQDFLYVSSLAQARHSMNAMTTPIGFFGHTHVPIVFTQYPRKKSGDDVTREKITKNDYKIFLDPEARYLINPGSIGQPRDGEPRASFVVLDEDELTLIFHRFEYNIIAESKHMRKAKIPEALYERIVEGN